MAYDDQNIFAKILRGEVPCDKVYESEHSLAFKDINPLAPAHILVIPKGPYQSMDDFSAKASDAEMADFVRAVGQVARDQGLDESGYRIIGNHGRDAHQDVPHLHIHVLGKRDMKGMLRNPS